MLLCGAVQPGRGVEPKHNVPRLKLSYKGKPILRSPLTPGYMGPRLLLVLLACLVYSLARGCSFMLSLSSILSYVEYPFFLFYFCESIFSVSLIHSLVSTQHLTVLNLLYSSLPLTHSFLLTLRIHYSSYKSSDWFHMLRKGSCLGVKCIYWPLYQFSPCAVPFC